MDNPQIIDWSKEEHANVIYIYIYIYDWLFKLRSKKKGNICTVSLFTQQSVSATLGCKKRIFTSTGPKFVTDDLA